MVFFLENIGRNVVRFDFLLRFWRLGRYEVDDMAFDRFFCHCHPFHFQIIFLYISQVLVNISNVQLYEVRMLLLASVVGE